MNKDIDKTEEDLGIIAKAIKPAERLNSISEYYFSTKLKEIAEMNSKGENVISLGIGSPGLPPSTQTVEALCAACYITISSPP